jgi:hypothetical protein
MAKTKISEWSSTPANNTDIDSINIAEGCAPSGINDAIRELMSQVKDLYSGTTGDAIGVAGGGTGQSSYTNGQLLIGNTTGNTLTKATLTAGTGISITNGGGSISIAASGGGDLVGPASSTDNAFTRFDGTTGKLVQNSTSATLSDDGTAFFKALSIDGTSNLMIFTSGAKIQMQTPAASANWIFETAGTNLTVSSAQSGQFNIYRGSANSTFGVGGADPSTSGAGITFPATQSASSDANTLDDYEEGTYTVTPIGFTVSGTTTLTGTYTKIGRLVFFDIKFANTGTIAWAIYCRLTLPFIPASINSGLAPIRIQDSTPLQTAGTNGAQMYIDSPDNSVYPGEFTTSSSGQTYVFSGFYRV